MRQAGFTLLELMVGLLIFGLMASAGTALLAGNVNAGAQARALADGAGDRTRLAALLGADCAQAASRPWRDVTGTARPAFTADDGALFTVVRRSVTLSGEAPQASVERVRWRLENSRLVRRTAAMIDGTDAGTDTVLLTGITSARLRVHDGTGWQERWTVRDPATLPRAIELTLTGPGIGTVRHVLLMGPGGAT